VIGAAALQASLKEATVAIVGPACLLILPALDTSAAIIRRKLTGRGLAVGDRGHLHHVLRANGLPTRRVLALVAALGAVAAGGALGSVILKQDIYAAVAAAAVVLILLAGGLFGNAEWRLIRERAATMLKKAGGQQQVELEVRLQGSANWQAVWREVTRAAEELNLYTVCLDVNAPAWHEGYHRRWDRLGRSTAELKLWRIEMPLYGHGQIIGRLTVVGIRDEGSIADKMRMIAEFLEAAETRAIEVARGASIPRPSQGVEIGSPVRLPTPA
jgi:UDP-GlcNAc:undecaprenyl-phosphate GlcNAc-1-phosphate transferase